MVSLWPWKSDDTSPASFEKTLSTLSAKIASATVSLDGRRQRLRRFKALWTLYSSFAYLLYLMIAVLVIGWHNWQAVEYTAFAGGPLIIYVVRLGLTTFYDYRISTLQAYVEDLQKQRDTTIDKLKAATKYNTTQELLEKYSGTPSKSNPIAASNRKPTSEDSPGNPRTRRPVFIPPPTANIPGRNMPLSHPNTPQRSSPMPDSARISPPWPQSPPRARAEFAPNAFPSPPQYSDSFSGSSWYDRLMDVLLGEDETHPKNRLALICRKCRLVNGQAPPGVKRLEDIGQWRCSSCGTMNGEESEARHIVAQINEERILDNQSYRLEREFDKKTMRLETDSPPTSSVNSTDEEAVLVAHDEDVEESEEKQNSEDEPPNERPPEVKEKPEIPKARKGRPKGSKNKT